MKRLVMAFISVFLIFQIANADSDDSHNTPAYTQQTYTLGDLYAIALERSEQIKISEEAGGNPAIVQRRRYKL